jgi:DNA-binding response OmpR family regulator
MGGADARVGRFLGEEGTRGDVMRVLLVQSDPVVVMVTTVTLRRAGYEVVSADDEDGASELLRDPVGDLHLIIVDVSARRIRTGPLLATAAEMRPAAAVLALGDEAAPGPEAADGYLRKPYGVTDLLEAITGALVARSRRGRAAGNGQIA